MRIKISETSVELWISAQETSDWADGSIWSGSKQGWQHYGKWPCSQLRRKRVFAAFDSNGLCDMAIDGNRDMDYDATEFSALCSDFLALKLPNDHPCSDAAWSQAKAGNQGERKLGSRGASHFPKLDRPH